MRGPNIVGRSHEISELNTWSAGPTPAVAYVHGVGGIGKSTLVRHFAGRRKDLRTVYLDATSLPDTASLLDMARDSLLVVDNLEQLPGTASVLRQRLAAHLDEGSRLMLISREPPSLRWHADFAGAFCALEVGELDEREAAVLLGQADVPVAIHPALIELCRGHPLMMLVAGQLPGIESLLEEGLETAPELIETLVRAFGGLPRESRAADAFVICAIARRTTESLLQATLDVGSSDARQLFDELRTVSWMRADKDGVFPHDLVRDAIRADAKWRDRAHYDRLFRAVARFSTEELREHGVSHLPDMVFLLADNPIYRSISAHRHGVAPGPVAESDDVDLVDEMLGPHFDEVSVQHVRDWHARGAIDLVTMFGPDGEPSELTCHLDQSQLLEAATEDPAVLAAREILAGFNLRPDAAVLFSRLHGSRESGQLSPLSNSRIMTAALQFGLQTPGLAAVGSVLHPPELWRPILEHSSTVTAHRDVEIGGKTYIVHIEDLRILDAAGWLEAHLYPPEVELPASVSMLDHDEFSYAVREALKALGGKTSTTLGECRLASTPLVLRAAAEIGADDRGHVVKDLLRSEISTIDDTRIFEAMRLTYLEPAAKQYAAAAELNVSFSTFRRALGTGVSTVIERLWQREIAASS